MRINNDLLCDLAAVLEFDDSQPGRLSGRFLRYTFVPGLGVGHPAILYDPVSSGQETERVGAFSNTSG